MSERAALEFAHFPSRFHAFVWRNWGLASVRALARAVSSPESAVRSTAEAMGLPDVDADADLRAKAYLTIIRRNWHLLPYEQLTALLDWSRERLDDVLENEDFLYIKLGSTKPQCAPIAPVERTAAIRAREDEIRAETTGVAGGGEGLFAFAERFTGPAEHRPAPAPGGIAPTLCYGYFSGYSDDAGDGGFPDRYLEQLAEHGISGLWAPGLLRRLADFPWDRSLSADAERGRERLNALIGRFAGFGLGLYLYLNEPRALPDEFFAGRSALRGAPGADGWHALCTNAAGVQDYLTEAVGELCAGLPDLRGIITISYSENLTNCWSRRRNRDGHVEPPDCSRCREHGLAATVAEQNNAIAAGIARAGGSPELIVWDWAWPDQHAVDIVSQLDPTATLMSVSEWGTEVRRGGVPVVVGEYSVTAAGPSERARRQWRAAKERGMRVMAKMQLNNSWELSTVPYIPVVSAAASHVGRVLEAGADGIMASWTLGGYPSPTLGLLAEASAAKRAGRPFDPGSAVDAVAAATVGSQLAPALRAAWDAASAAFAEYPYSVGTVYTSPAQLGPANLLWPEPTGWSATMVGFPYDDLDRWRGPYPPDVFVAQLHRAADGFGTALATLAEASPSSALDEQRRLLEATQIHLRSMANQARFVQLRDGGDRAQLRRLVEDEMALALRLRELQLADSRLGFEASNHYAYTSNDLLEKVLNCRHLLDTWLAGADPAGSGR